jgi:hypothetical protein
LRLCGIFRCDVMVGEARGGKAQHSTRSSNLEQDSDENDARPYRSLPDIHDGGLEAQGGSSYRECCCELD